MKSIVLAATAGTLALTATTPALADTVERQSAQISAAGIDLATPEGQKLLDERIARAARKVCDVDRVKTGSRIRSQEVRVCYDKAIQSAKRQVAAIMQTEQRGG